MFRVACLLALLCLLLGHRRSGAVWFDDVTYRAACRRCGRPMLKDERTREWRLFVADDHRVARRPRPDWRRA